MTDDQIKELIDTNFRVLFLLGIATSLIMDYKKLEAYHDDSENCDWFMKAIENVVYLNKPWPEMPF
jgi:hypothetical protein